MKKRLVQALLLSVIISSLGALSVAPMGHEEVIKTDVAAQNKSTEICELSLYSGINMFLYNQLSNVDIYVVPRSTKESFEEKNKWHVGYTTDNLNVRKEPTIQSEVVGVLSFDTSIHFYYFNEEWLVIIYEDGTYYVSSKYVSKNPTMYKEYILPNNSGFKSYMSYKSIKNKSSSQYLLQSLYAYTGNFGIRQVNGRYCVAIGTAFKADIGTYVDLILENETVIPCIVSDIKADIHTQSNNIVTAHNGCVSEFVVDKNHLPYKVRNSNGTGSGDISDCCVKWDSPVRTIKIYDKNIL